MSRKEATRRVQLLGHHIGLCHCLDLSVNASWQVTFHKIDIEERTGAGLGFLQQENTVPAIVWMRTDSVHSTVIKLLFSDLSFLPPHFREEEIETGWFSLSPKVKWKGSGVGFRCLHCIRSPGLVNPINQLI